MNCFIIDWVSGGAVVGYVAAMVCSIVHVDLPSSSTSGGHSEGGCATGTAGVDFLPVEPFIIAIHAAEDVQVRHLVLSVWISWSVEMNVTYGFPSLSRTTPGACLDGCAVSLLVGSLELDALLGVGNGNDICWMRLCDQHRSARPAHNLTFFPSRNAMRICSLDW